MTDLKQEADKTTDIINEDLQLEKKKEVKLDEDGMIIVAEHVPVIFTTYIQVTEDN